MDRLNNTISKLKELTMAANCTTNGADPWPSSVIGSKTLWASFIGDTSRYAGDFFVISMKDNNFVCGKEKKATLYAYCNRYISDYLTYEKTTDMLRTLEVNIVTGNSANSPIIATKKLTISDSEVTSGTGQSCSCDDCRVSCTAVHPRKLVIKPFTISFNGSRNIRPNITAKPVTYPVSSTSGWTFCGTSPAPALFSEGPRPAAVLLHVEKLYLPGQMETTNYRTALVTLNGLRRAITLNASGCDEVNQPSIGEPL